MKIAIIAGSGNLPIQIAKESLEGMYGIPLKNNK